MICAGDTDLVAGAVMTVRARGSDADDDFWCLSGRLSSAFGWATGRLGLFKPAGSDEEDDGLVIDVLNDSLLCAEWRDDFLEVGG